ncbi:MAG: sulfotransferase [Phycisphaerales bacterium]
MGDRTRKLGVGGLALPVGHLLALAPLDVWARLIWRSGVGPRYWLRLVGCLLTSWVGTVVTMPERLVLAAVRLVKFRGASAGFSYEPGVVVVLGYYRSGTTHLHNLLACDPRVVTPRWYQCLAGQGWWLSWAVVRFLLTPFLGQTRPQDGVGFGGNWPGEDDFALATWGFASSLPGRFVLPEQSDKWARWHGLDGLSKKELGRWRSLTAMFCWKVTRWDAWRGKRRVLVLKSPSHTARVAELDRLFGGNVRFVRIERDRASVVKSNVKMHAALAGHALQALPDEYTVRERIEDELDATDAKCERELSVLGEGRVVRVAYSDLVRDPVGEMERVSAAAGLVWDDGVDARDAVVGYLHRVGKYRSVSDGDDSVVELPADPEPAASIRRTWFGIVAGLLATLVCSVGWLGLVWVTEDVIGWDTRLDGMVWVTGGVVGVVMARAARVGSVLLGVVAGALTLVAFWGTSFPIEIITDNWWGGLGNREEWLDHNGKGAVDGVTHMRAILFTVLGVVTAWRHGSRVGARAPGT